MDVETFLDFERFLLGDNPADNTHEDVFQDFVFEVNPQNGQTVTAGGLEEVTLFMCYEMHFFFYFAKSSLRIVCKKQWCNHVHNVYHLYVNA